MCSTVSSMLYAVLYLPALCSTAPCAFYGPSHVMLYALCSTVISCSLQFCTICLLRSLTRYAVCPLHSLTALCSLHTAPPPVLAPMCTPTCGEQDQMLPPPLLPCAPTHPRVVSRTRCCPCPRPCWITTASLPGSSWWTSSATRRVCSGSSRWRRCCLRMTGPWRWRLRT